MLKRVKTPRQIKESGERSNPLRWTMLGSGATLAAYGFFFFEDLESLAYPVVILGVLAAAFGPNIHAWGSKQTARLSRRWETPPMSLEPAAALENAWRHFQLSFFAMAALGAFSLWRVQVTVWRPVKERFYFFAADSWIGRLEHSWFNDALYAFGMVGLLYVLYTAKEFLSSRFSEPVDPLFGEGGGGPTAEQWNDHQERSKLMIGTGIVIILIWAWLEEIADLVPGYIFDKWDINAIYVGFILGYTMMRRLSYPMFSLDPPFSLAPPDRSRWLEDGIRILYVVFVWAYTSLVDPATYADRWSHIAELSVIILGSMWLLDARRRNANED